MIITKNNNGDVLVIVGTVTYDENYTTATVTDIKETSYQPDNETAYNYGEDMKRSGHDAYIIPHHFNGNVELDICW